MPTESANSIQHLWNYCKVLRDDGKSLESALEQFRSIHEDLNGD